MSETVALLVVSLVALVLVLARCRATLPAGRRRRHLQGFCAGPHNIGVYDAPYKNYPSYEGRAAVSWDGDRRCMASCQQSPCVVWCR